MKFIIINTLVHLFEGGMVLIEDLFDCCVAWCKLGTQHVIPALKLIYVYVGTLGKGRGEREGEREYFSVLCSHKRRYAGTNKCLTPPLSWNTERPWSTRWLLITRTSPGVSLWVIWN